MDGQEGRNGREPWPKELSGRLREVDRLRRGGRVQEALAEVRALADAHPAQARVLLELGLTLSVWAGAPEEALPVLARALALAPGLLAARLQRALALARLGRHAEALAEYDALEAARYRNALLLHSRRAVSREAVGDGPGAAADWTRALAEEPRNPWLLERRALVHERLGRLAEAEADLSLALEGQQGEDVDPELLLARHRVRLSRGDVAGARADAEAGLAALRPGERAEVLEGLTRARGALPPGA
jgi:tetratricopeptide (TPR) repeat protein